MSEVTQRLDEVKTVRMSSREKQFLTTLVFRGSFIRGVSFRLEPNMTTEQVARTLREAAARIETRTDS